MKTFALALLALGLAACADSTSTCDPANTPTCDCPGGAPGRQTCAPFGAAPACVCPTADAGGDAVASDAATDAPTDALAADVALDRVTADAPAEAAADVADVPACDADTQSDPMNCGRCGRACALFQNAATTCVAGVGTLGACNRNFANCDGMAATGCEVDLQSDVANCTRCGMRCGGVATRCVSGICVQ